MKGDDRFSVVQERCHKDLPRLDIDLINCTASDDMNPDDLIFAIEGDDPKPLRRFGLEVEEILEEIVTD